ncbi:hypothetical protein F4819DRAFT_489015 [Hypoxylon fuscum]|nr:hypothetical protein F4819DRAFT_489015 [Hypoxylon fuscum]
MASPAVALPNGVPASVQFDANANAGAANNSNISDNSINTNTNTNTNTINTSTDTSTAQSITNASIKRKRESTDVGDKPPNGLNISNNNRISPAASNAASSSSQLGATLTKVDQPTIRNYYEVLKRFDPTPSVLKRPLPDNGDSSPGEPQAKRKKTSDGTPLSIADKVAQEYYEDLDNIILDLQTSITDLLKQLRVVQPGQNLKANDEATAKIVEFKRQAHNIFKRELTYPGNARISQALQGLETISDLQSNASGNIVLTLNGEAMRGKQLYSSLQQVVANPNDPNASLQPLRENGLPNGIKVARAIPYSFPAAVEKEKKAKTLGELFPAPRNLPSLQPPKAPKSTTKGVQVGWHRPELTEKSKYRSGSYFSQTISAGRWLDYSNAAPPSQIMTKQRERALSLAGNKPSSSDLEMSEMESLFRGAFSSFAPSKDDSAAMVSSGLISQTMWWQKVGKRNFDRLIENELGEDAIDEAESRDNAVVEEVDEDLIKEALDDWDESMVDPSLEQVCCPKKPDGEKDVDDLLQDVSDMIQTLLSYQKNRNLTLPSPSTQSRYAADPAHSDMLTNGTPEKPGEEEMATYETLKAQLGLVIQMLPPYAVARLNSDKLEELNISTKIELRTDEYQGLMEEDEAAARVRAAQAAAAPPRPNTHRASSSSSNVQYGQPYHGNRAPMPSPQFYGAQTPVRPPQPNMHRPPQTMPPNFPARPPSNTGYRPNHYPNTGYSQPYNKPQPFSQPPAYGGTPAGGRPPYQPMSGYSNVGNQTPQTNRFPQYTPNTQPQPYHHHQPYHPQHQPPQHGTPTHPPYGQYTNGAGPAPQRTASPHVPHHPPQPHHSHQPIPHHTGYNPAQPPRQPSYGTPTMPTSEQPRRYYQPPAGSPVMPNNSQPSQHGQSQNSTPGSSSFQTSLNPHQVQQAMDQAKARFNATKSAERTNEGIRNSISGQGQGQGQGQVGPPVGLGGIGLGGDPARLVAARAGMPSYQPVSHSPNPPMSSPGATAAQAAVNGTPAMGANANGGQPTHGREG